MKVYENLAWIFYIDDECQIDENDENRVGKWMYFFSDKKFVSKICEDAVKNKIVAQSKHSNSEEGVACFYLNYDDIDSHKKIISYFINNNLIQKTKTERFYNISFKLDNQTRLGEYGDNFHSDLKLSKFIDLDSGKWILE